jgi:hydrogenase maturation protease
MTQIKKQIKVLVLGLGNELLKDDGVGVHIVRAIQKEPSIEGVIVVEVGSAILHAQHLLEQAAHVIAIDAVRAGDEPGALYCFDIDQAQLDRPASLHELGIVGLSRLIPEYNRPQITILGIEPKRIDYGMQLSTVVQASVFRAVEVVRKMIINILSCKAGNPAELINNNL